MDYKLEIQTMEEQLKKLQKEVQKGLSSNGKTSETFMDKETKS